MKTIYAVIRKDVTCGCCGPVPGIEAWSTTKEGADLYREALIEKTRASWKTPGLAEFYGNEEAESLLVLEIGQGILDLEEVSK